MILRRLAVESFFYIGVVGDPGPVKLSAACAGWIQLAGYTSDIEGDVLHLRGGPHADSWYQIRRRPDRRIELLECTAGALRDEEELLLFARDISVVERHVLAIFGDTIRDDLDLPYLELGWQTDELAEPRGIASDERGRWSPCW